MLSETVAFSIYYVFFFVDNLEGVGFTDYINKVITVDPKGLYPQWATYLVIRSIINGATIKKYIPNCYYLIKFTFILLQTLCSPLTCVVLVYVSTRVDIPITPTQLDIVFESMV